MSHQLLGYAMLQAKYIQIDKTALVVSLNYKSKWDPHF
jgi:hypothetical protein